MKGGVSRGPARLGMADCDPARGAGRWLMTMGPPSVGLRNNEGVGGRPGLVSSGTRPGAGPGARTGGLVTGARAWLSTPPREGRPTS